MKKKSISIKLGADQDRPVAMLVQVASQFDSKIHIESEDKFVNAKSIMGMMTVTIADGEEITVVADGSDENDAIASIEEYLTAGK
ncbi:MAG: HPr family phosphocarrier protein [Lachnospiraceae bacterium]|nr:HPr family phosphocarrier protein [Lachnospiraceae bacterium]